MAQKVIARVYDATSGAGGTVSTAFPTEGVDAIIIVAGTSGAAAATNMTVNLYDPNLS